MCNKIKNSILTEVFRMVTSEKLLLYEAIADYDDAFDKFSKTSKRGQFRFIKRINSEFLKGISTLDPEINKYALKKFQTDKSLTILLLKYIFDGKSSASYLENVYQKIYINYLLDKFLSKSGFFGRVPVITGVMTLDKILLNNIKKNLLSDLSSGTLPPDIDATKINYLPIIDTNISKFDADIEKNMETYLKEGLIPSSKINKVLRAIRMMFPSINGATIGEIRNVLKTVNKMDLDEYKEGGTSNISALLSIAVMNRGNDFLKKITMKDNNLDYLLTIIAKRLLTNNSDLNRDLKKDMQTYMYKKLRELRSNQSRIGKYNAKIANYGN